MLQFAQVLKERNEMLDGLSNVTEQAQNAVSPVDIAEFNTAMYNVRSQALAIVLTLADDILNGDLDDEESPSDRLNALTSEYEDEIAYSVLVAHMQDAMMSLGVEEALAIDAFLNGNHQDETLEAIADVINSNVPEDDEYEVWAKEFIYAEPADDFEDDEAVQLDGMMLDGAKKQKLTAGKTTTKKTKYGTLRYKAVKAVRNGEIVTVKKRISGHIVLSANQKKALNKARAKSHTASAIRKQMKSLGVGIEHSIYQNMDKAKRMQGLSMERHNKALKRGNF